MTNVSRASKSRCEKCRTALEDPQTTGYKSAAVTTQGDKGQIPMDLCCGAGGTHIYAHVSFHWHSL